MRHLTLLGLISLAALTAATTGADAQNRRRTTVVVQESAPPVLRVRPRSFLDAGNVVQPGTTNRYATRDIVSYINNPPYANTRDLFGAGLLPDPIGGPFVGARNPFGPVDYAFR